MNRSIDRYLSASFWCVWYMQHNLVKSIAHHHFNYNTRPYRISGIRKSTLHFSNANSPMFHLFKKVIGRQLLHDVIPWIFNMAIRRYSNISASHHRRRIWISILGYILTILYSYTYISICSSILIFSNYWFLFLVLRTQYFHISLM